MTLRQPVLDMSRLAGGAFGDGQFRLFFLGIFFAVQAIWVQRVTLGWLAWERTGSAAFVGVVAGLSLAPALVLGPFFGVMADRVDIRRAAFATNGMMAPVLAGWIIATAGAGVALWVSVLCYLPMLMVLPRLTPRTLPARPRVSVLADLRDGMRYAVTAPLVRMALLLTLIFATVVRGALEILPVLADGAFGRGAAGLGMLTAAAGFGAVLAAFLKAAGIGAVGARIPAAALWAAMAGQGAVLAMGLAPIWPMALAATAVTGFCATWVGVSMQAAIQSDLPDGYRGRVMSLWIVVGFGTVALGAFAIGGLGEWLGISGALVTAGLAGALVQGVVILGVHARR